jgi:hypothetical protein
MSLYSIYFQSYINMQRKHASSYNSLLSLDVAVALAADALSLIAV